LFLNTVNTGISVSVNRYYRSLAERTVHSIHCRSNLIFTYIHLYWSLSLQQSPNFTLAFLLIQMKERNDANQLQWFYNSYWSSAIIQAPSTDNSHVKFFSQNHVTQSLTLLEYSVLMEYYVVTGKCIRCEQWNKAHDQNVVDLYAENLSWQTIHK
jgi:hypothetical protein